MVNIKSQLNKVQKQLDQYVKKVKTWPQFRKIGALIIILGLIALIIGLLIY